MLKENYTQVTKEYLTEATRAQLIQKSKNSDNYRDPTRSGENRYTRRTKSKIATTVADYNRIDMNAFFKGDILEFGVRVQGETNNYVVMVIFENLLKEIQKEVQQNKNKLEFRCIVRALMSVFNHENVYVSCSCPDWTYRQAYWATKNQYNSGDPQPSNGMAIANPNDTKGAGCKHVNLVLANLSWVMKIASTINNYINYCRENMENNYARYIFPVIYGMNYDKAVQLTFNDFDQYGNPIDELSTDENTVNLANALGKDRGKFRVGERVNNQNILHKKELLDAAHAKGQGQLDLEYNENDEDEQVEEEETEEDGNRE